MAGRDSCNYGDIYITDEGKLFVKDVIEPWDEPCHIDNEGVVYCFNEDKIKYATVNSGRLTIPNYVYYEPDLSGSIATVLSLSGGAKGTVDTVSLSPGYYRAIISGAGGGGGGASGDWSSDTDAHGSPPVPGCGGGGGGGAGSCLKLALPLGTILLAGGGGGGGGGIYDSRLTNGSYGGYGGASGHSGYAGSAGLTFQGDYAGGVGGVAGESLFTTQVGTMSEAIGGSNTHLSSPVLPGNGDIEIIWANLLARSVVKQLAGGANNGGSGGSKHTSFSTAGQKGGSGGFIDVMFLLSYAVSIEAYAGGCGGFAKGGIGSYVFAKTYRPQTGNSGLSGGEGSIQILRYPDPS